MRWSDIGNGTLLSRAAKTFDAFITVDQNIRYQQNLSSLPLMVIVLIAPANDPDTLRPYAPFVLKAVAAYSGRVLLLIHPDGRVEPITTTP
jgi:hypothetical protein